MPRMSVNAGKVRRRAKYPTGAKHVRCPVCHKRFKQKQLYQEYDTPTCRLIAWALRKLERMEKAGEIK